MNLYHLRYFVTLAHLEHYTRAAELLSITQPSLSHAISYLESELGVALFEKDGRNIVLTKYGRLFLDSVEKSLSTLDAGVNTLKMVGSGEGTIELGFLRTLGTQYIPDLLRGFLATHTEKKIRFQFHTGVSQGLIQGLKDKKYDLVFCSKMDQEPSIEYYPVSKQELVLIVPTDHPLAGRDRIDLSETLNYPHIRFTASSGLRSIVDGLFDKIGGQPEVAYEIEEDQVVAGMVAGGFGIAVVPHMPMLDTMDVNILRIESPSWERFFYLAVVKNRFLPPAVRTFVQYAVDHAELSAETTGQ